MLKTISSIIERYDINAEQVYILSLLYTNKSKLLSYQSKIQCKYENMQNLHRRLYVKFMSADMDNVERLEYIEFGERGLILLQDREFIELCSTFEAEETDIDTLVSNFRDKFPEGVSSQYAKPFRGVLGTVKKNMIRFKKEFKQYSDETILLAAERMVNTMTGKGKKDYISQAHYFIYKNNGSELAEECERVLKGDILPPITGVGERTL